MQIVIEMLPIIVFFVTYQYYGMLAATGALVVATIIMTAISYYKQKTVSRMQLFAGGLLVVFAAATLISGDSAFIMYKVSVVQWLFAAILVCAPVFLKKTVFERMFAHVFVLPPAKWRAVNAMWIVYFLCAGAVNLFFAERALRAADAFAAAVPDSSIVSTISCAVYTDAVTLCLQAQQFESDWVSFKLYGLFGSSLVLLIAQGIWLRRFIADQAQSENSNTK